MKLWLGGLCASLAIASSACFSPAELAPCSLSCADDRDCPGGQLCSAAGLCALPDDAPSCAAKGSDDAGVPEHDYAFAGDDFDDGDIDLGAWRLPTNNITARAVERYGQLHFQPPAVSQGYYYLETSGAADLRGKTVELEVFGAAAAPAVSFFELAAAAGSIGLRVNAGNLEYVEIEKDEPRVRALGAYLPAEHRRWRLSVDDAGTEVTIELVGADGTSAAVTEAVQIDLSAAYARFGVRTDALSYIGPSFRVGSFDIADSGPAPDCALACTSDLDCDDGSCPHGLCVSREDSECLLGTLHGFEERFDELGNWAVYHLPSEQPGTVTASDGLAIDAVNQPEAASGILSRKGFDLRDSHVIAEIRGYTSDDAGAELWFGVSDVRDASSRIAMGKLGPLGTFELVSPDAEADTGRQSFELPVQGSLWRISEHSGVVYLEVSRTGDEWKAVHTAVAPFPLDNVKVFLGAGASASLTPGTEYGTLRVEALNRP